MQLLSHAARLARTMGPSAAEAASAGDGDAAAALGVTPLSPDGQPGGDAAAGGGSALRDGYTSLVQELMQVLQRTVTRWQEQCTAACGARPCGMPSQYEASWQTLQFAMNGGTSGKNVTGPSMRA